MTNPQNPIDAIPRDVVALSREPALKSAIAQISADEEIATATKDLVRLAIQRATYLMQYGSPPVQMQLFRSFLPVLARGLAAQAEDETLSQMKVEHEALKAEMRASLAIPIMTPQANVYPLRQQG